MLFWHGIKDAAQDALDVPMPVRQFDERAVRHDFIVHDEQAIPFACGCDVNGSALKLLYAAKVDDLKAQDVFDVAEFLDVVGESSRRRPLAHAAGADKGLARFLTPDRP